MAEYMEYNGKRAEEYVEELQDAIDCDRDYSVLFRTQEGIQHMYFSALSENSSWYLITIMPEGTLDESITKLDVLRIAIMIGSAAAIMLTMSVIFILYYRFSQQQMARLAAAERRRLPPIRQRANSFRI